MKWRFRIEHIEHIEHIESGDFDPKNLPETSKDSEWAAIPVPSQWQQYGFGRYAYGQRDSPARDSGHYRRQFEVPAEWVDRRIDLVFGGAMTDTTAWIDGRPVGPIHRGGFTEFRWEVTGLLRPGHEQQLDVRVQEHSANESVNRAERQADYWTFGGIYRPVWLEARPMTSIGRVAIDAPASGELRLEIDCAVAGHDAQVRAVVRRWSAFGEHPGGGNGPVLATAATRCREAQATLLEVQVSDPAPWSAERPHLHTVELVLEQGEAPRHILHRTSRRFGFRTVERRDDGLYLNGSRLILKGVNRHSFRPETGRTLSPQQNRDDVALIRSFHFNAVRTAHSPPDPAFLDACDELGLYVIDELPGWHDAYDMNVGRSMVREMVQRDQHHPSILFWANGNEGGWNRNIESEFGRWDPQKRIVLRPWSAHNGFETRHYPSHSDLVEILDERSLPSRLTRLRQRGHPLVMPTEILHGLYDGGGGAGLGDYWQLLASHPRFAGLFLWALFDEGIERSDRNREVDTFGNHAPDGLFDPYRRPEPSARRAREIFAPVQALGGAVAEDGSFEVRIHNAFHQLDLAQVQADVEWFVVPNPFSAGAGAVDGTSRLEEAMAPEAFASRRVVLPAAAPGEEATLRVARPIGMPLALTVGSDGNAQGAAVGVRLVFQTSAVPAPRRVGRAVVLPPSPRLLQEWRAAADGRDVVTPAIESAQWILRLDGGDFQRAAAPKPLNADTAWVLTPPTASEASSAPTAYDLSQWIEGLDLRLCDAELTWFGRGPDRVWGNRRGGSTGLWARRLEGLCPPQDAVEQDPGTAAGLYDALWLRLSWPGRDLVLLPDADTLIGLGSPRFRGDARQATALLPELTEQSLVLWQADGAPGIGTKFHPAAALRAEETPGSPTPPGARLLIRRTTDDRGGEATGSNVDRSAE